MKREDFVRLLGSRQAFVHLAAIDDTEDEMVRPAYAVVNGIALISIYGLLGDEPYCDTRYSAVQADLAAAVADESVTGIALMVNSPGGFVTGSFECAAAIAAATKPVCAVVAGIGYSGAYLLASQAQ